MPCRSKPMLLLAVSFVLLCLAPPAVVGQEATPAGGTPPAAGGTPPAAAQSTPLLRLTLEELPPANAVVLGMTRTAYAPAGALRAVAGAGPSVFFVETGNLVVRAVDAPQPILVVRGDAEGASAPEPIAAGSEQLLAAGAAFLLPAGAVAELRNDGQEPAATLDLLTATDARLEAQTGITQAILARREASLPAPPVTLSLEQATIPPGDRLPLPAAPAEVAVATVDRAQTFLLTGGSFNRGQTPMPVYILTVAPAGATPPP